MSQESLYLHIYIHLTFFKMARKKILDMNFGIKLTKNDQMIGKNINSYILRNSTFWAQSLGFRTVCDPAKHLVIVEKFGITAEQRFKAK